MTTNEETVILPIAPGDVLVEVQGAEVRFWLAFERGEQVKVRLIGKSFAFMGERVLQSIINSDTAAPKVLRAAPELTSARIYSAKNRTAGGRSALAAAVELVGAPVARVHFYYSGCGPSGQRWGFGDKDHYTISA